MVVSGEVRQSDEALLAFTLAVGGEQGGVRKSKEINALQLKMCP
jgi:hypothetical protein